MQLHVRSDGDGPPLVLLHGWAMHGGVFDLLLPRLADRYTLHRVDLPGHGLSPSGTLALEVLAGELAKRFGPADWLGWSLGGLACLQLALDHPDCVRSLTLVGASPRFTRSADWPSAVEATVFEQFADALHQDVGRTLERFLALETLGAEHAQDERHWLRQLLQAVPQPSRAVLVEGLQMLQGTDLRAALPTLRCPSLWIGGRRDRLVPPEALQAAAAAAPGGRAVLLERAAHAPFIGRPEAFAEALLDFLQSCSDREAGQLNRSFRLS